MTRRFSGRGSPRKRKRPRGDRLEKAPVVAATQNDSRIALALEHNTSMIKQSLERRDEKEDEDERGVRYKIDKDLKKDPPNPAYHPHTDLQEYMVDVIEPHVASIIQNLRRSEVIAAVGYGFRNTPGYREKVVKILEQEFPAVIKTSLQRQVGYSRVVAIMTVRSGRGEIVMRKKRSGETYLDHFEYVMSFYKMTEPLLKEDVVAQRALEVLMTDDSMWGPAGCAALNDSWLNNLNSRINCGLPEDMDKVAADKFIVNFRELLGAIRR